MVCRWLISRGYDIGAQERRAMFREDRVELRVAN